MSTDGRAPASVTALSERWTAESIARGLVDGDLNALAALFDRMQPLVNRLVWRLLGADSEHDDLVQQVFLNALQSVHTLRDASRLEQWMVGVTANTVRHELRSRSTWRRFFSREPVPDERPALQASPHLAGC